VEILRSARGVPAKADSFKPTMRPTPAVGVDGYRYRGGVAPPQGPLRTARIAYKLRDFNLLTPCGSTWPQGCAAFQSVPPRDRDDDAQADV